MNIEELRNLCKSFPAVTEDIKWENHLCFNIGRKMFLITGLDQTPITASFKVDDEDFLELSTKKGFKPAPYLARYKWIHCSDINLLAEKKWKLYAGKSYSLIKSKLSKKILKELEV